MNFSNAQEALSSNLGGGIVLLNLLKCYTFHFPREDAYHIHQHNWRHQLAPVVVTSYIVAPVGVTTSVTLVTLIDTILTRVTSFTNVTTSTKDIIVLYL